MLSCQHSRGIRLAIAALDPPWAYVAEEAPGPIVNSNQVKAIMKPKNDSKMTNEHLFIIIYIYICRYISYELLKQTTEGKQLQSWPLLALCLQLRLYLCRPYLRARNTIRVPDGAWYTLFIYKQKRRLTYEDSQLDFFCTSSTMLRVNAWILPVLSQTNKIQKWIG